MAPILFISMSIYNVLHNGQVESLQNQIFVKNIALKQYQNRTGIGKLLGAALEPLMGACGMRGLVFEVPALGP